MTRRFATGFMLALLVGGLVLPGASPGSAQMGPGIMGQGQTSMLPVPQMAAVIRQMADRLAAGKGLQADRAERLRHLADQLVAASGRMAGGMGPGMMGGGMMGGGMMGQGSEQMNEISRILGQISDLLRGE